MIYLIRHMQSEANVKHIAGGDYPLTDKGISDAKNLKKQINLTPDFLVSSPLIRARQTAELLFPEKKFIIDNTFREINFGVYEDTQMEDNEFLRLYNTKPSLLHEVTKGDIIKDRADKAIAKLYDYLPNGEIVIVCHDTLIRSIICRLKGESLDNMPKYKSILPNGSIVKLSLSATMEISNNNERIII